MPKVELNNLFEYNSLPQCIIRIDKLGNATIESVEKSDESEPVEQQPLNIEDKDK